MSSRRGTARERLAQLLAVALGDSGTRAAVKRRLDASNAPEGKVQFQALVQADQSALLASLVRAGATSAADLLADLNAARGLELYLPVAAQRAAWTGDLNYLVGTIGSDGDVPVGFDARGSEHRLDPRSPPDTPVLALVPQETDFTRGHPERMMSCVDMCSNGGGGGGRRRRRRRRRDLLQDRARISARPVPGPEPLRRLLRELAEGRSGI